MLSCDCIIFRILYIYNAVCNMVSCSYQSQEQLSVNSSKFILTYTEFMGGDRYTSFDCCKFQCLLSIFTETSHNLEAY